MTRFFLIAFAITFAINYTQAAPLSEEKEEPLVNPYKDVVCDRMNDLFTRTPIINKQVVEILDKALTDLQEVDNITLRLRNLNEIYNETSDKLLFECNEIRKIIQNKKDTFLQEVKKNQQDLQNAMEVFKAKTKKLETYESNLTLDQIFAVRMYSLENCLEVQMFIPIIDNIFAAYQHIDLETFNKDLQNFVSRSKQITAEGRKLEDLIDDDDE
ncbi:hypothetical protein HCN44_001469 [Aphidius gifuensis]|uniref:Odorant-binding protein n=1 Tax=Aphidius gifuensis TaxID=684658 RepID=A0A835CPQ8_APHGI|nr:uncharacterized protein LOC122853355 [Aphidius gifuensis]KAF7992144.1 hypothetical protein HCN44_001469 [Aphidius gifuensis]